MLELLKVLVQPIVLERDDDGKIVGERNSEPRPLYTKDEFLAFYDGLVAQIESENSA